MITTLILLIGALGGLSAVIVSVLYYRENRNRKRAEIKAIEIDSLTEVIEQLKKDRDSMRVEIDDLKRALRQSDSEKISIEKDLNCYVRAFNCRVECDKDLCPVEKKINELKNKSLC